MQKFIRWDPVEGIPESPAGWVSMTMRPSEAIIRVHFSGMIGNPPSDVLLKFEDFHAIMDHYEFAHPDADRRQDYPLVQNERWSRYTWPLMLVEDSAWLSSFSSSRLAPFSPEEFMHYRIVTLATTLDVLTARPPTALLGAQKPEEA